MRRSGRAATRQRSQTTLPSGRTQRTNPAADLAMICLPSHRAGTAVIRVIDAFHRGGKRYGSVMSRKVLIVSTVEHADDVLRAHVGQADTIKVVVPVVRQGFLDWLANDQQAFGHAERVAERTAEQLPGETVDAVAGEANVGLAIRDALATFPADEIVVAVRPTDEEGLVESIATESTPHHSVEGLPVRYVVIPD